jgi:hypothetical protein
MGRAGATAFAILVLLGVGTGAAQAGRAPGKASGREVLAEECAVEDTICEIVERRHGRVEFLLIALAPGARNGLPIGVCVKAPRAPRECKSFTAGKRQGAVVLRVDFARNFRHSEKGRYVVTWRHEDNAVKHSLSFEYGVAKGLLAVRDPHSLEPGTAHR